MAARTNKAQHDDRTREKIRTSQLLNRLHYYALSEVDPSTKKKVNLESGQIKAIEILLRKSMPDLQSVEGSLNLNHHHEQALKELE